ncbi:hypothetical protein K437DRAFT_253500 [Tilletiaria anomala UBC 951]|uniref:Transcription initiation factor IIF subunit beta n=1 Tax=Tilletiaria anomala (strain ATCC 24038 / CBS 436.72 / UBC 951) TaxID=1037660 RepID=A0A066WGP4_TILAU|nr:uncharacterized protein K437DRAFT_253500 [Tilletiaria anomala UBC 951]KDN53172.1 hypothetical protein K437DRAFT_253500 [Tilletiaria anomala UBC 951]
MEADAVADSSASGGAAGLLPPEDPLFRTNFFDIEPDEDLDLSEAHNQVWLVKVPKFLAEGWGKITKESLHLGTVRVYDAPEGTNPRMELLLPAAPANPIPLSAEQFADFPEGQHVPRSYDLRLTDQNTSYGNNGQKDPRNLYAFREKRPREDIEEDEAQKKARKERGEDADLDDEDDLDDDLDGLIDPEEDEDIMPLHASLKGKSRAPDPMRPLGGAAAAGSGQKRKRHSKFRRHTALVGTVTNEAAVTPQLMSLRAAMDDKKRIQASMSTGTSSSGRPLPSSALDGYRKLMKVRSGNTRKPGHGLVILDEADNGLTNRISSGILNHEPSFQTGRKPQAGRRGGEKFARIPRNELLDQLFTLYEREKYYTFAELRQRTQQPESYLREVLQSIAVIQQKGQYSGKWGLRQEYSQSEARRNEQREVQREKEEKERAERAAAGDNTDDNDDAD